MKIYTVIVVDDEPIARAILESYVRQSPRLSLLASVATGAALMQALKHHPADLLLLDIQLKGETSFQTLRRLPVVPKIIFVTANKDYAAESYEVEAVDYLLKPVSLVRFEKAVERFIRQSADSEQPLPEPAVTEGLYFKTTTGLVRLAPDEICYCEARRDYVKIIGPSRQLLVNTTMKALTQKLQPYPVLIRIHKSYLVNRAYIRTYDRHTLYLVNGTILPVGDHFRKAFQEHWPK